MYYNHIYKSSVTDGPGVRISIYVSGCRNHCKGCHNPESWNFHFGKEFTDKTVNLLLQLLDKPYVAGLTICGGEPMDVHNQSEVYKLVSKVKELYPDKNIWCYTGYTWEELQTECHTEVTDALLGKVDVLVAGRFVLAERDISDANRWRGSRNQRVIDVQKTLNEHKVTYVANIPNNN